MNNILQTLQFLKMANTCVFMVQNAYYVPIGSVIRFRNLFKLELLDFAKKKHLQKHVNNHMRKH